MRTGRFWLATLGALAGMALAAWLGLWQWGRAEQKISLLSATEARAALPALDARALLAQPGAPALLHRTVVLQGQWLPRYTVFLDNRQLAGQPGFYVVTPLRLHGSDAVVLVQRGWAPRNFEHREQLPPVQTPGGEVIVRGRIAPPPSKLYELGGAGRGLIRQNLDLAAFRRETGLPLIEGSVQQTGLASEGLRRDWPVPASGADRNYGYAFQWWAIGSLIFVLYVWFQFIAPRRRAGHA